MFVLYDFWKAASDISKSTLHLREMSDKDENVPFVGQHRTQDHQQSKDSDEILDPYCNPDSPKTIRFEDVTSAAFKIRSAIIRTPCTRSPISKNIELYLKRDYLQRTGSFKERGARYALMMLSEDQRKKGVITASAGNHALALSYQGKKLGVPTTVVLPTTAPIMKVQSCYKMGAKVIIHGNSLADAKKKALQIGVETGKLYINGYDHPMIIAGQGTIGLEVMEQLPDVDAVIVPVGGGGLIAGVCTAVKGMNPNVLIIGVESVRSASFSKSTVAGRVVAVDAEPTIADGLAVPVAGCNAFATANKLIDEMIVVDEDWIAIAILQLVEKEKSVVEGAGAVGIAAILSGQLDHLNGKKVVVIITGGNIDTTILGRCLERGLAAVGRLVRLTVCVSDRPGGVSELVQKLSDSGVMIKHISHERAWLTKDIFSVKVLVVCETRNWHHTRELMTEMKSAYNSAEFAAVSHPPRLSSMQMDFSPLKNT